jgi:hypothetical protein
MNRFRGIGLAVVAAAMVVTMTGCPNGGIPGTFALYIINATSDSTIGLVGVDNHLQASKDLVDVLDENIPAGSMKLLVLSEAAYGDESGTVEIGIVNLGFESIEGVPLGPDPIAILVEDDGNGVSLREIAVQS